ncbi:MAG: DUF547 domain-containing protein [Bacteroidota bacterium]
MLRLFRSMIASGLLLIPALTAYSAGGDGEEFHHLFSSVLKTYVHEGLVDYAGIEGDARFEEYLTLLAETDPDTLGSPVEQLAFWINAYNAYTIKLIIDRMPVESIRDISLGLPFLFGPWSMDVARVGGEVYTLNALEHDIIREQFSEPRIHFALVCAAIGCPALRAEAYEGPRLYEQLDEDTRRFVTDPAKNRFDVTLRRVHLSEIFNWYESDFEGEGGGVAEFVARYVTSDVAAMLKSGEFDLDYLPYDWSLNSR